MEISEKITKYCENKEAEKVLSKETKVLGSEIKKYLMENPNAEVQSGVWKVELQHRISEDFDEAKVLMAIKAFWVINHGDEKCPFVKAVEYVDMEALEGALYKGEIPEDVIMQIDSCRVKKESDALVYSKKKGA